VPHPFDELSVGLKPAEAGFLDCFIRCRTATSYVFVDQIRPRETALDGL
jgi:hypothetical protein